MQTTLPEAQRGALAAAVSDASEGAWAEALAIERPLEREKVAAELYDAAMRAGKPRKKKLEETEREHAAKFAGLPPRIRALRERQEHERVASLLYPEPHP